MLSTMLLLLSQTVTLEPLRVVDAKAPSPAAAAPAETGLKEKLRLAFETLNARKAGVFHEDVTSTVAPYFPPGQLFDETQRVLRQEGLGSLEKFKGVPHDHTAMFVVRARANYADYPNVYVVIDFDFGDDMRLHQVKAFLRASNM